MTQKLTPNKSPSQILVGDIELLRHRDGRFWLIRADGEAMEIGEKDLYELLDEYFDKSF